MSFDKLPSILSLVSVNGGYRLIRDQYSMIARHGDFALFIKQSEHYVSSNPSDLMAQPSIILQNRFTRNQEPGT
jgi:hypothetical protein